MATLGTWDLEGRDVNFKQRCAIRFCFRLGHKATETFAKLQQAYGDNVLSRAQVFRWFKAFSEGRESIEDEPRSRRPSSSRTDKNVNRMWNLLCSDRRLTVRMIGEELNLTHTINNWVLHYDNAPCHTTISINQFLASKNIPVAPQLPYSRDLSPCDFFFFPRLKNHFKGRHFQHSKTFKWL
ncbi:Protein GVQW3 [Anthophora quadrimaculata]